MIECPNCGQENMPHRAFCETCGEQLPTQISKQPPSVPSSSGLPKQTVTNSLSPKLQDSEISTPPKERTNPSELEAEENHEITNEHLPSWLQGMKIKREATLSEPLDWDEDLDFSDLPDWPLEEMPKILTAKEKADLSHHSDFSSAREDDLFQSAENQGTGLLAGIIGPIPIEPVITIDHEAPAFPVQPEIPENTTAANLFAQIAGGAIVQEPVSLPDKSLPGVRELSFLLLIVIIIPLATGLSLLGAPPLLPATRDFGEAIANSQGVILLAFDYEGNMSDELEPAAIATLKHLQKVAESAEANSLTLLTVSTTPQGPALAEQAWAASQEANQSTKVIRQSLGYLPGGSIGLRSLLAERILANNKLKVSINNISLIIVIADETAHIQRWIEQIGAEMDNLPMLAIAPATTETTLMPYLASGQLDGLLAGIPGTASYDEYYSPNKSGIALRRIDAVSLGALLIVIVIVTGNIAARRAKPKE